MIPIPWIVSIYETVEGVHLAFCDTCFSYSDGYEWVRFAEEADTCCICHTLNAVDVVKCDEFWTEHPHRTLKVEPIFVDIPPIHFDDTALDKLSKFLRINRSDGA